MKRIVLQVIFFLLGFSLSTALFYLVWGVTDRIFATKVHGLVAAACCARLAWLWQRDRKKKEGTEE